MNLSHVIVYRLGASDERHTHRLTTVTEDATHEDIRRAIGASIGADPADVRLVVISPDAEGAPTTGPIRLHTDLPEAQWPSLTRAELARLIKLMVDRRYRAEQRGATNIAEAMSERLTRARALRDGR
jgi:hypothetical protein